jgi:hypothetical protein
MTPYLARCRVALQVAALLLTLVILLSHCHLQAHDINALFGFRLECLERLGDEQVGPGCCCLFGDSMLPGNYIGYMSKSVPQTNAHMLPYMSPKKGALCWWCCMNHLAAVPLLLTQWFSCGCWTHWFPLMVANVRSHTPLAAATCRECLCGAASTSSSTTCPWPQPLRTRSSVCMGASEDPSTRWGRRLAHTVHSMLLARHRRDRGAGV